MIRIARSSQPIPWARHGQGGFSLIELMVSMLVASFLIAAMFANYISVKATYNAQNGLEQLQDGERLILTMVSTTLQLGGYFVAANKYTAAAALPAAIVSWPDGSTASFAAGQAFVGAGSGGGSPASDDVAVQFQTASGDGLMNCQGVSNPASSGVSQVWINAYSVDSTNNQLLCSVNGGTPVPLIDNVRRMNVLYGVDTNGDGSTDTYLPGNAVTAAGLWGNVHTAQVAISFINPLSSTANTTLPASIVQVIDLKNRQ